MGVSACPCDSKSAAIAQMKSEVQAHLKFWAESNQEVEKVLETPTRVEFCSKKTKEHAYFWVDNLSGWWESCCLFR